MISIDIKDEAGRIVGTGWTYTDEELASMPPPPDPVEAPLSVEERLSALESVATGDAPDLATAKQAVLSRRSVGTIAKPAQEERKIAP